MTAKLSRLNIISIVAAIILVARLFSICGEWLPHPTSATGIILVVTALALAYLLIKDKQKTKLNIGLSLFIIWSLVATFIARPTELITSISRWMAFALSLLLLSPLAENISLRNFRDKLWQYTLNCLRWIALLSGILIIIRILGIDTIPAAGILNHRHILAIVAAVALIDSTGRIIQRKNNQPLNILTIIISWGLIIYAGARIVITGTILAVFTLFVGLLKTRRDWIIALSAFFVSICCAWGLMQSDNFNLMVHKTEVADKNGSMTYSRDRLWGERWIDISNNPCLGVGFGVVNHYEGLPGCQQADPNESGSSWLLVASDSGVIGLTLLLIALGMIVCPAVFSHNNFTPYQWCALAIFTLLLADSLTEGWILFAGSFPFFLFWLSLSELNFSKVCQ